MGKQFPRDSISKQEKSPGRLRNVRTPETIDRVCEAVIRSPKRSAWCHSMALQLANTTVCPILHKDLSFHPYKIQIVQEITVHDIENRL